MKSCPGNAAVSSRSTVRPPTPESNTPMGAARGEATAGVATPEIAYSSGRMCGNSSTSRIEGASANSITVRSTPNPSPAAGGMPYSRARM
jgi:hypothetical protein